MLSKISRSFAYKGTLYTWGANSSSLGYPANKNAAKNLMNPVETFTPGTIQKVVMGNNHSAVVTGTLHTASGKVYTFGRGEYGALGHDNEDSHVMPKLIDSLDKLEIRVQDVALGSHHTVLLADGDVWTMGYGGKLRGGFWRSMFSQTGGGLGHGDKEDRFVPTPVEMLREKEATVSIAAGSYHTMALGESGTLYLWGKGEYGVLGNGHNTNIPIPNINTFFVTLQQEEEARIKKIAACNFYSGVVMEDGRMFTWGRNDDGQMAIGPGIGMDMYETEKYPAQILGDFEQKKVVDFEPGESISVFLTDTDDVYIAGNKIWWLPSKLLKPEGEKVTSIFAVGKTAGFVTDYKNVYCVGSLFSTKYMEELPKLKIWRVREEVFQGKRIEAIGGAYRNFYAILS